MAFEKKLGFLTRLLGFCPIKRSNTSKTAYKVIQLDIVYNEEGDLCVVGRHPEYLTRSFNLLHGVIQPGNDVSLDVHITHQGHLRVQQGVYSFLTQEKAIRYMIDVTPNFSKSQSSVLCAVKVEIPKGVSYVKNEETIASTIIEIVPEGPICILSPEAVEKWKMTNVEYTLASFFKHVLNSNVLDSMEIWSHPSNYKIVTKLETYIKYNDQCA